MDDRTTSSRRTVLRATAAAAGLGLAASRPGPADAAGTASFLAGRGISDATGEVAECGMMGYGRFDQQAAGLHTRLRVRSFVIATPTAVTASC